MVVVVVWGNENAGMPSLALNGGVVYVGNGVVYNGNALIVFAFIFVPGVVYNGNAYIVFTFIFVPGVVYHGIGYHVFIYKKRGSNVTLVVD